MADLDSPTLFPSLRTRWLGRAHEWIETCASTNDVAAARARGGAEEGLVIAADAQTVGRGRLGRTWHSPAGQNLYLSIVLRPRRPPAEIPPLTLLAGAAVARALDGAGVRARLKWPNDVLADDVEPSKGSTPPATGSGEASSPSPTRSNGAARKLAGILTEMSSEGERVGHVVVGIGLNVNAVDFPPEIAARATSLRRLLGRPLDRIALLAAILESFEPLYDDFAARGPAAAVTAWREHAALGDRWRVKVAEGSAVIEGAATGIDPDGALLLRDDAGRVHRVLSGEILP